MILAVDIGNTNTVLGFFDNKKLISSIRLSSDSRRTEDEWEYLIRNIMEQKKINISECNGAILSSVVPGINTPITRAIKNIIGLDVIMVGPGTKTGLKILYEDPKEVGADRIVNAVGVKAKYGYPAIIIDLGTATTFCVIDEKGDYLGGIISPGIKIAADSLFEKTAKIPRVDLIAPKNFLNKNTVESIKSGIIFGHIGQIEYLVKNLKQEQKIENAKVIATGGLAGVLDKYTDAFDIIDNDITLFGLLEIYEKNITNNK